MSPGRFWLPRGQDGSSREIRPCKEQPVVGCGRLPKGGRRLCHGHWKGQGWQSFRLQPQPLKGGSCLTANSPRNEKQRGPLGDRQTISGIRTIWVWLRNKRPSCVSFSSSFFSFLVLVFGSTYQGRSKCDFGTCFSATAILLTSIATRAPARHLGPAAGVL